MTTHDGVSKLWITTIDGGLGQAGFKSPLEAAIYLIRQEFNQRMHDEGSDSTVGTDIANEVGRSLEDLRREWADD